MKHTMKRALALLIALLLAVPTFAFADEPADGIVAVEGASFEGTRIPASMWSRRPKGWGRSHCLICQATHSRTAWLPRTEPRQTRTPW